MVTKNKGSARPAWSLAAHGGAGGASRSELSAEDEAAARAGLKAALDAGAAILDADGPALDAVEAAVQVLEDDPLFNAGRGSVLSATGDVEMDAAVMDGATLGAGAVAGLRHVRNPVALARAVMERSTHVMLIGAGAETFAAAQRLALEPPEYFVTERRQASLAKALAAREAGAGAGFGTVGAVARDRQGRLAAATSTGGTSGKAPGRVGDTPIIGAGTYANGDCAVSCTGTGELFIRLTAARDIAALAAGPRFNLAAALEEVVGRRLAALAGEGGVIAVTADGNVAWRFNAPAMYRGRAAGGEPDVISIWPDEP